MTSPAKCPLALIHRPVVVKRPRLVPRAEHLLVCRMHALEPSVRRRAWASESSWHREAWPHTRADPPRRRRTPARQRPAGPSDASPAPADRSPAGHSMFVHARTGRCLSAAPACAPTVRSGDRRTAPSGVQGRKAPARPPRRRRRYRRAALPQDSRQRVYIPVSVLTAGKRWASVCGLFPGRTESTTSSPAARAARSSAVTSDTNRMDDAGWPSACAIFV